MKKQIFAILLFSSLPAALFSMADAEDVDTDDESELRSVPNMHDGIFDAVRSSATTYSSRAYPIHGDDAANDGRGFNTGGFAPVSSSASTSSTTLSRSQYSSATPNMALRLQGSSVAPEILRAFGDVAGTQAGAAAAASLRAEHQTRKDLEQEELSNIGDRIELERQRANVELKVGEEIFENLAALENHKLDMQKKLRAATHQKKLDLQKSQIIQNTQDSANLELQALKIKQQKQFEQASLLRDISLLADPDNQELAHEKARKKMRAESSIIRELAPEFIANAQANYPLQRQLQQIAQGPIEDQIADAQRQGEVNGHYSNAYQSVIHHRKWNFLRNRQWGNLANDVAGDAFQGTINLLGSGLQGFGMEAGKTLFQILKARISARALKPKPHQHTLLKPKSPAIERNDSDSKENDNDEKGPTIQQMLASMALERASEDVIKANTDTLMTNLSGYRALLNDTQDETEKKRLNAKIRAIKGQLEKACDMSLPIRKAPATLASTQTKPEAKEEKLMASAAA